MTSLLVTGDRKWRDRVWIETVLQGFRVQSGNTGLKIVEGCAKGADMIAHTWGDKLARQKIARVQIYHCPAEWGTYGKAAGPRRNQEMLNMLLKLPQPRFVLAFHDDLSQSKGTKNMVNIAREAGITVRLHSHIWEKYT